MIEFIGERISSLRKKNNLTLNDVAEKTNITQSNLSYYENNKTKPSADALIELSNFYGTSIDWILKGSEISPKNNLTETEDTLISNFRILPLDKQMRFLGRIEEAAETEKQNKKVSSYTYGSGGGNTSKNFA